MSFRTQLSQLKWDTYSFLSFPFCLFPIQKNKIVFQNFSGRGYGDSGKYIAEYIINNNLDYELVWLCDDLTEPMPSKIKKVKFESARAYYEMATAGIWISNVWTGVYPHKRKEQFFLQTWHASIAFKKIEKSVEAHLSSEYVRTAKRMGKQCDLLISNATWLTNMYKRDMWYNGEILESGLPRIDVLYNTSKSITKSVHQHFHIDEEKAIVLYAPTFRKNEDFENYKFNYNLCCRLLKKKFGKDYAMLVRLHPNSAALVDKLALPDGVYDATNYPDMQYLLAASDILITDYSSSMFEMAIVKKIVFIFAKDYNMYIKKDRGGTHFSLNELPFPICQNENELWQLIDDFSAEEYNQKLTSFLSSLGVIYSNNSAKQIVDAIEERRKQTKEM